MEKNKRILIFNVNWLGDVLFSTAVIRNIRRNFPQGFIACAVPGRCYPVLKDNPYLDEVILFDEKDRHKGFMEKMSFVQLLKAKDFDMAILLHGSMTRALICRLAGIPQRLGYNTKKRGFLLTKKIAPPQRDALHRIDYYLNVIEKSGFKVEDRHLDFFTNEEDEKFVDAFLDKEELGAQDLLIGINAGGNWLPKRWLPRYWADLGDRLGSDLAAKVIITGGTGDSALAKDISAQMRHKPVITCGKLNLKQSAVLFKRLDLFISADSGPLHIANAVGAKKIIALFGPTSPEVTGPFPLTNTVILQKKTGCKIPCYMTKCKDNRCMQAITPEEVFEAARKILSNPGIDVSG